MEWLGPTIASIVITLLIAFIPPIVYMVVLRFTEKYERESWGNLITAFLWGCTMVVFVVILVRGAFAVEFAASDPSMALENIEGTRINYLELILLTVIVPVTAEIVKPLGLFFVRNDLDEAEDGLIYGACIGLGYAATENLLYGIFIMNLYGISTLVVMVIVRSLSVMLINAFTGALTGYGISRAVAFKHKQGKIWMFPVFLLAAIVTSALFNFISAFGFDLINDQIPRIFDYSISLFFAILLSIGLMTFIYFKVYRLDRLDDPKNRVVTEVKSGSTRRAPAQQPRRAQAPRSQPSRVGPVGPVGPVSTPAPRSRGYQRPPASQSSRARPASYTSQRSTQQRAPTRAQQPARPASRPAAQPRREQPKKAAPPPRRSTTRRSTASWDDDDDEDDFEIEAKSKRSSFQSKKKSDVSWDSSDADWDDDEEEEDDWMDF